MAEDAAGRRATPPSADDRLAARVPPHNLEAEACVLGCMLLDRDVVADALQHLDPDSFYNTDHRRIFEILVGLYDRGSAIDPVVVREEISKRGLDEQLGDVEFLTSLTDAVPSAAHAEHYARIVRDKAIQRRIIHVCSVVMKESYDDQDDSEALLDRAEQRFFEITQRRGEHDPVVIGDVLKHTFELIDNMRENRLTGLDSGFYHLNDHTSGLHPSELIVLAGRPSMGKTTFALSILRHMAVENKQAAALFSLEMTADQIAQNLLCNHARVSMQKLRRGFLNKEEVRRLMLAAGTLSEAQIHIDESPSLTLMELRAKARRLKMKHDIQIICVDYLQLMETRTAENRQQEIATISRGLKSLARELNVPVIAISQLSRAAEQREGHKPRLSDLRESGSIEQDADVVLLLYREEYYSDGTRPGEADVIIAKQRNGPTGEFAVAFLGEFLRFENLSGRDDS